MNCYGAGANSLEGKRCHLYTPFPKSLSFFILCSLDAVFLYILSERHHSKLDGYPRCCGGFFGGVWFVWVIFLPTESQSDLLWKGPLQITQSNHLLKQAAHDHIQAGFECLWVRRLHKPSGHPFPVLCHPQSKEFSSCSFQMIRKPRIDNVLGFVVKPTFYKPALEARLILAYASHQFNF